MLGRRGLLLFSGKIDTGALIYLPEVPILDRMQVLVRAEMGLWEHLRDLMNFIL